ncbi:MAG: LOG family protein [Melioribacteraceae bacterium]|nr:LOG family protein [Melioribacteraceae bacterium]
MKKIITVFGSAHPKPGEEEYETAYKLGAMLGKNGFSVCSGGFQGIMDGVSKGATEKGGEAIGVTVNIFSAEPSKYLTKEIKCNSLFDRIEKMVELGDAYIILRGGTGTLVELSIVWEYVNKNLMQAKPIFANGEMWKPIIETIDRRMEYENRQTGIVNYIENIEDCERVLLELLQ